jgi:hypothetical protein
MEFDMEAGPLSLNGICRAALESFDFAFRLTM